MKFIAGLRVWGNWEIGENVLKVFLRLRGSANRRVDLFLPLIASNSGRRQGALESLADCGTELRILKTSTNLYQTPVQYLLKAGFEPNRLAAGRERKLRPCSTPHASRSTPHASLDSEKSKVANHQPLGREGPLLVGPIRRAVARRGAAWQTEWLMRSPSELPCGQKLIDLKRGESAP